MTIEFQSVMFRSEDPQRQAAFWGAMLNRTLERDGGGIVLAAESGQVGLAFAAGGPHGEEKNRLHLHLADGPSDQSNTIAACLKLGARLLGSGRVPENSYAVMEDPGGDEFCVIEDGNAYLAGCGPLGEVTCEGTRTVGLFWSQALGWPLVWEEGEETAIQSRPGGTKIAWSGDSVSQETDRHRQSFVVSVASHQLDDEVGRLLALGASGRVITQTGETILSDPDGNTFEVRTS
jgi:hypothetical protein